MQSLLVLLGIARGSHAVDAQIGVNQYRAALFTHPFSSEGKKLLRKLAHPRLPHHLVIIIIITTTTTITTCWGGERGGHETQSRDRCHRTSSLWINRMTRAKGPGHFNCSDIEPRTFLTSCCPRRQCESLPGESGKLWVQSCLWEQPGLGDSAPALPPFDLVSLDKSLQSSSRSRSHFSSPHLLVPSPGFHLTYCISAH